MDQSPHGEQTATLEHSVSHAPVSKAIYGLITVLAVLQVLVAHPPSAWQATGALFGATIAVALADAYSACLASMLGAGRALTREDARTIWHEVAPVMVGAQGPTVLLLVSALGLLSVGAALSLAQAVAFVLLFGYGWRVGQLLHERWWLQLANGLLLVAIGGIVVGIKAAAFH